MSKSIIVIDTPSRCGDCRLADFGKCWGSNSYLHLSTKDRPKECPLRPMPKKINVENIKDTIHTEFQTPGAFYDTFRAKIQLDTDKLIAIGYNMCVDEILGENENG